MRIKALIKAVAAWSALTLAMISTPAFAGPFVALIPLVVGAALGTGIVAALVTVAATMALSALTKQKQRPPGIMIERTLDGGTNPRSLIVGTYATAGSNVTPPMSHGKVKKTPNAFLTKIVAICDATINSLSRVIVNGEYVPLSVVGSSGQGTRYNLGGKYSGKGSVIFYDGSQTQANASLTADYSSYIRPWNSNRIGRGVAYVAFEFQFDADLYKGEPDVRIEVRGIHLYDVRKDSTAGGSGSHRWDNPSTWEFTENPIVMIYNILRGITLDDGSVYGGECEADDLPVANWAAGMNIADETVQGEPRYRAGLEFALDEEPADVIEELMKAAASQIVENGGVYKIRVGPPSLPVMFITDDDWIVSKDSELDPFPSIHSSKNTIEEFSERDGKRLCH